MDASDPSMEFFDFEKGFGDVNTSIQNLTKALEPLVGFAKKMEEDYPYPMPGAKKKKKKGDMADGEDDEDDECADCAKLKAENADLRKQIEEIERKDLLDQFSKLKEDDKEAVEAAKDFSKEQLQALINVERKSTNFGKTTKGKEDSASSDFSKNAEELKTRYSDFRKCGLNESAEEVKQQLAGMGINV
jgi:hypothetical protein